MPTKSHQTQRLPPVAPSAPPAPPAPPAPLAPPARQIPWDVITIGMIEQGCLQGIKYGALFGGVYSIAVLLAQPWFVAMGFDNMLGFVIMLIAFAMSMPVGAVIGACTGVTLGLIISLIVAIVSRLYFSPLRGWWGYRASVGILCAGLAAGAFLWFAQEFNDSFFDSLTLVFEWGALIVGVAFWRIGGHLAACYAKHSRVYDLPVLLADRERIDHNDRDIQHILLHSSPDRYRRALRALALGQDPRKHLLKLVNLAPGMRVCDLLAGNRDLWPAILEQLGPTGRLMVVSPALEQQSDPQIEQVEGDALFSGLPEGSIDALLCSFRAALVPPVHLLALADSIYRALGPHGIFGLVEFPKPEDRLGILARGTYLHTAAALFSLAQLTEPRYTTLVARQIALRENTQFLVQAFAARGFEIHCYQLGRSGITILVGMKL